MHVSRYLFTFGPMLIRTFCLSGSGEYPGKVCDIGFETLCITGVAPWCNPYGKSFKYIIKSRGPSIEPWGTQLITVSSWKIFHALECVFYFQGKI
jgi:hypothetical protein